MRRKIKRKYFSPPIESRPYANEHAARLRDPGDFESIKQIWEDEDEGIRALGGPLKSDADGPNVEQAIRFDADKWTPSEAEEWLDENDYTVILFEEATGDEDEKVAAIEMRFTGAQVERLESGGGVRVRDVSPPIVHRTFRIDDVDDADEIEVSVSSEYPVDRWGIPEYLDHDEDAVDIKRLSEMGSVLWNHDGNVPIGCPLRVWIDKAQKKIRSRMRWGTDEDALKIRHKVRDKSVRGVSVGYCPSEFIYLENEDVSYKRFTGPAWVVTRWEPFEFSLTPIPADPSVGIGRTLNAGGSARQTGGKGMKWKVKLARAWVDPQGNAFEAGAIVTVEDEDLFRNLTEGDDPIGAEYKPSARQVDPEPQPEPAADPEPETPEAMIERKLKEDRERRAECRKVFEKYGVDVDNDILESDATVDQVRAFVLEKLHERQKDQPTRVSVTQDGVQSFRQAAMNAIAMRSRLRVTDEERKAGGEEMCGWSLIRLAEECVRRKGLRVPGNNMEIAGLALQGPPITSFDLRHDETISSSTSDFPYILAATANKAMLEGVAIAPVTYPQWCKIGTAKDFKTFDRIRLSEAGKLEEVAEGGTYNMTKFAERREQGAVLTYGKAFNLSRQMIINDDLQAFTDIPRSMGRVAAILPNDLAVTVLLANGNMSDGNALFSSNHSNLDAETDRRLDTIAHAKALINKLIEMLYQQSNYQHADVAASEKLNLRLNPAAFMMPPTGMQYGRETLKASGFFDGSGSTVIDGNHLKEFGIVPVVEPTLEDTNLTGNSTTATYLFADPNVAPVIEVTFLNGVETPFMEEVTNVGTAADGRVMKVRMDCTASKVDWLGAIKATGVDA
jgi:hypothetical protein